MRHKISEADKNFLMLELKCPRMKKKKKKKGRKEKGIIITCSSSHRTNTKWTIATTQELAKSFYNQNWCLFVPLNDRGFALCMRRGWSTMLSKDIMSLNSWDVSSVAGCASFRMWPCRHWALVLTGKWKHTKECTDCKHSKIIYRLPSTLFFK